MCTYKLLIDKGSWYRWAFERLGLEYRYERFFRYLKERTIVFHHKREVRKNAYLDTILKA
jgi:transposase-like protein